MDLTQFSFTLVILPSKIYKTHKEQPEKKKHLFYKDIEEISFHSQCLNKIFLKICISTFKHAYSHSPEVHIRQKSKNRAKGS